MLTLAVHVLLICFTSALFCYYFTTGGLNTFSRALAAFLVPLEGESLVSHVRIVDKYSVAPPTTYLGSEFTKVLEKPEVEYKQANLTVPSIITSMYDSPEGQAPYEYVFDLTGEVRHDRTEMIQINTTCKISRSLALEAAKRKVKAYIRLQLPFYETSGKGTHDEKDDPQPEGTIGTWWHETLRMLSAIEDLNLVILRVGLTYGPYIEYGYITTAITVASVYGWMKKPMKTLHSPGKHATNTVHVDDVAGALWACANWMALLGRKEADSVAGTEIFFHNDKNKVSEVEGMPPHNQKLVAPLFNLVDDSNNTYLSVGQTVTSIFGTTFEFFNIGERTLFKFVDDAVEEINEHHVGGWTEMIQASNPPITNTTLSAYMDKWDLDKHTVAFNNNKIKQVVGYQLKRPEFNQQVLKEIVDKWREEHCWPNL
ncbi:hypothetical protein K435DRAFT_772217 [Dendrothele bispora CBS 962.96]|uniref:NAD(P)-binding protein n=1 Tax=Dendrothele bispora (strain CBS 962.96) TaxID=1314807 RepID=A0A4S8MWX0_DENBC|nr:hypothetical protein K435DRAFT_772217 [Dendrothele bispora CBS 962.96]